MFFLQNLWVAHLPKWLEPDTLTEYTPQLVHSKLIQKNYKTFCRKVYHPVPVPCQLKQEEDSTVTMKVLPALLLVGLFAANQNSSLFWSFYDFGLLYSLPFNWKHIKCFELFFPLLVLLFIPRPLPSSLTAVCRLAGKDRLLKSAHAQ